MGVQPVHRPAVRGQPQVGRRVLADSDGLPRGQSEGRLLREAGRTPANVSLSARCPSPIAANTSPIAQSVASTGGGRQARDTSKPERSNTCLAFITISLCSLI